MKKKSDAQSVSDLLKKLQASYLGGKDTEKKKSEKADADDEKFREKLAAMLGKATASSEPTEKKTAKKKQQPVKKTIEEPVEEPTEEVVEETVEKAVNKPIEEATEETVNEPKEETVEEALTETETPEPKANAPIKASKPRGNQVKKKTPPRAPKKARPAPVVEEQIAEEPIIEEVKETEVIEEVAEAEAVDAVEVVEIIEAVEESIDEPIEETKEIEPTEDVVSAVESEPIAEEEEELTPSPAAHPLDKIIPVSLFSEAETSAEESAEEVEEAMEEPVVETVEEPIEETQINEAVAPKVDDVIVIRPKPPRVDEAPVQEPVSREPIRITPRVTIPPRSDAYDFAKEKPSRDPDTIVIRPPESKTATESIVIRPRTADKPRAVPQLREETASAQPIRIGKEVRSAPSTEVPSPTMKKEKNVTFIPPTPSPSDAVAKSMSSASADATDKPSVKGNTPTVKKRRLQRFVNEIPVTVVSSDEGLEEVLDEPMPESETLMEEVAVETPDTPIEPPAKLSLFQRRQQQRQRMAEQKLSAAELIRKKSGLSEDDVAMILELGYEHELGQLVGYENLKRLKSDHVMRTKQSHEEHYATAFGYRGDEYVGDGKKETVIAAYLHDRKALLFRLCLTALLSLLLLFTEMPHLIGGVFAQTLENPRVLTSISTALLCLVAIPSLKQIIAGLRAFFRFSPTPYSVPALMLPMAILYGLAVLIAGVPAVRIHFPVALSLLLVAVCDVLRLSCELRTLRLISAEGDKHVLVTAQPRKKKLRNGKKIVKIINDDTDEPRYEVRVATQTTGFFRRFNAFDSAVRPFTVLIYALFSLATLTALFGALYTSSATVALSAFTATAVLCMPLSAVLTYFYPLCRANRLLSQRNCALVGEEAVDELACPKTLIFRDTNLCSVKTCTEIAVRDGDDFRNDLRLSCILFRKLGGTLSPLGTSVPPSAKGDPNVSVVRIQDDGVEAMIDHLHHVLAGSADFLRRGGVRVPRESSDKALRRTANVSPMYVAIDGVLKLNYEIQYKTDDSFLSLVRSLADTESQIALYSYDPNLTDAFLQTLCEEVPESPHAFKPGRFEEPQSIDLADTGAVALGRHTDLAHPVYAATAIGAVRRFGFRMQLISTLLGAGIAALLILLGELNLLTVLTVAGYHVFWLLVSILATHSEINREKLGLK